jgi:hypothetical protein
MGDNERDDERSTTVLDVHQRLRLIRGRKRNTSDKSDMAMVGLQRVADTTRSSSTSRTAGASEVLHEEIQLGPQLVERQFDR